MFVSIVCQNQQNDKKDRKCQIGERSINKMEWIGKRKVDSVHSFRQNEQMQDSPKRQAILNAAHTQFRQYGYRKTSMEDIARELGISRASLYSYFENKDEIFRCVSISLHDQALAEVKACLQEVRDPLELSVRLEQALLARHRPFQDEFVQSPHGVELHDEYSRLCGDIVTNSHQQFQMMLTAALKEANKQGEIHLKQGGVTAGQAAELLNLATAGLKRGADSSAVFDKRVHQLVNLFVNGLK